MRISSGVDYAVFIAVTLQNVGGGRVKRLFSPSQFHQEGGRVAVAASRVRISSDVDYAVFIAIALQNVGVGGLLGVREGDSGRDGEDIYGSGGGKGCISIREEVCGGGIGGRDGGIGVGVHS